MLDISSPILTPSFFFRTVAPDPSRSLDYYRKACDEGSIAEACHRYSAFFIKGMKGACDKNMQEAFTYSLKGIISSNSHTFINLS